MNARDKAIRNDKMLLDMALYAVSDGQTKLVSMADPAFLDDIQAKFNYYKLLVKTHEITMEELEEKIYAEFGIVEPDKEQSIVGFHNEEEPIPDDLAGMVEEAITEKNTPSLN